MTRRPFIAGNWKMNGLRPALTEAARMVDALAGASRRPAADILLCPPATILAALASDLTGSMIGVGGQDCHRAANGANTGDLSAEMLKDAGATAVIVGHSERRTDHGERDADVRGKVEAARRAGLLAIVCIGETLGQRRAGLALEVAARQLVGSLPVDAKASEIVVAYEPVWAIGTGLTASTADVAEVHAHLRAALTKSHGEAVAAATRIVYGGSVKPANAAELAAVANVDGMLVGGASLKAADFLGIIAAYQ